MRAKGTSHGTLFEFCTVNFVQFRSPSQSLLSVTFRLSKLLVFVCIPTFHPDSRHQTHTSNSFKRRHQLDKDWPPHLWPGQGLRLSPFTSFGFQENFTSPCLFQQHQLYSPKTVYQNWVSSCSWNSGTPLLDYCDYLLRTTDSCPWRHDQ